MVTNRAAGEIFYQKENIPWSATSYNSGALGDHTYNGEGTTAEMHYDNILIQSDTTDCCLSLNGDLSFEIPCIQYFGINYGVALERYINPADPFGLYWKLSSVTVK